jgi:membrane protein
MIKNLKELFAEGIWERAEEDFSSRRHFWLVRQLRMVLYTARSYRTHKIPVRSAALTYYTIMAIVPMVALAFAIAKGFSLEDKLSLYLTTEFDKYKDIIEQIIEFVVSVLERTSGGLVAIVGIGVLLWAVIRMFFNVENAFNEIWEVKRKRGVVRKFTDYMALIFIVPILLVLSVTLSIYLKEYAADLGSKYGISHFVEGLFKLLPYVVSWITFSFLYYVMPSTNVKPSGAIKAGIITGTILQILQFVYLKSQGLVSGYNVLYGSFAAIPLFLIWVQLSWLIMLVGAELTFAFQNADKYIYERIASKMSYHYRKKVVVTVMYSIVSNFLNDRGEVSADDIAQSENLSVRLVRDALFELEKAGLVKVVTVSDKKSRYYIPGVDVSTLRVYDVIERVERSGMAHSGLKEEGDLQNVSDILNSFSQSIRELESNTLIKNIKSE